MQNTYENFINTLDTNSAKFASYYSAIGDADFSECTKEQIEEIILNFKPVNPREITTICSIMGKYADFLGNVAMADIIRSIKRKELWEKAKANAPQRYISNKGFNEVCRKILLCEEYNAFYKNVLFRAVYEGIYNEDMSVVKNLRASDIHGNVVTLRDDNGNVRDLEISSDLAKDLIELSMLDKWERQNKHSAFSIPISGEYPDNCFKCETRPLRTKSNYTIQFRNIYHRLLRNIVKEYVDFSLPPSRLYISGIMYRICRNLKDAGYDAMNAFGERNKNSEVSAIISDELTSSGYTQTVANFKEAIRGHHEIFFEEEVTELANEPEEPAAVVEPPQPRENWLEIYLNYACPKCFNGLDRCTCGGIIPGAYLVHLDRNLQQPVHDLNKKGFRTIGCCESHYDQEQGNKLYINFAHEYQFGELLPVPEGFKYNVKTREIFVVYSGSHTAEEREAAKAKDIVTLQEWCNNLPDNSDKKYEISEDEWMDWARAREIR